MHRWRFPSGAKEAKAVTESCRDLIQSGINPRDILVLLSNQRILLPLSKEHFQNAGVEYEPPRAEGFLDSRTGRLVLSLIRVVCNGNDYVAHRVLLSRPGVGIGTCSAITAAVIANNLNYRSIFYQPLPAGVFSGRALSALNAGRSLIASIQGWQSTDTVGQRLADIVAIVTGVFGPAEAQEWQAYANALPSDMTLEELRDLLWADTDDQQATLLEAVAVRLNLPIPPVGVMPPRVRVMTMHGAKGLSAKVVFIPGLEEAILPGHWRQPYPGLVLEAARLLYVSITRARAACIVSYAGTRIVHGQFGGSPPSRFAPQLGGVFALRAGGLTATELQNIATEAAQL